MVAVLDESNINSIINLTVNDDYLISMYILSMSKCIQYYDPTYVDLLKDKIELLSLVYGPFQFLDDFILIFFKWCFKVCQQFPTCKITQKWWLYKLV